MSTTEQRGNTFVTSADPILTEREIEITERITYVEQHAYDTLWIDYWQVAQPSTPTIGQVWFNDVDTIKSWDGNTWVTIPISFYKLYVKATSPTKEIYAWSGTAMSAISVPLTRASIEAVMGDRTVAMAAYNIDMTAGERFTKTCAANSVFTISNPVLYKAIRLVITGGTLAVPTFTGYTSNWILGAVVTDYVPANSNILWCEIRTAGQIHLFWGE